jgi:hypothetical protein
MNVPETPREIWALCRVARDEIVHLRYSIEAYEGLAVTTTLPGGEGLVRIYTEERLRPLLERVLASLALEMSLEVVEWGEWSI